VLAVLLCMQIPWARRIERRFTLVLRELRNSGNGPIPLFGDFRSLNERKVGAPNACS
jgi:hypothetical protein